MFTLTDKVSRFRFAGLVALVCALATVAAAQAITLQSITPLFPFQSAAINASGQIAGLVNLNGGFHAAVYSHGVVTDLGALGSSRGNTSFSSAQAINDSGQVVGYSDTAFIDSNGNSVKHAFLYSGGLMRDLGNGTQSSFARGINASGEVVGSMTLSGGAFLYSGGVMRDLGPNLFAEAINDAGDIVGQIWVTPPNGQSTGHAFLYRLGAVHDLGALQPGGSSWATAVNARGQITGFDSTSSVFLYANGVMTNLGVPGNGGTPHGINNSGQIVGEFNNVGGAGNHAFLYNPSNGFLDLNSLLPPNSGWQLLRAEAINDAGQIVGWGNYMGQYTSFLLTINTTGGPPVTTPTISGPTGVNGWYHGAVSVTLSATSRGGSVAATYFSVDGAAPHLYAGTFPISGDGTHQLSYYSVDTTGSQEPAVQQTIGIDSTTPLSHVAALPATTSTKSFNVSWSGADPISGVASYTIFVADTGGAFLPWISGTTAMQATYTGVPGHTYGFYSIATDLAGNRELTKTSPEAVTALPGSEMITFQSSHFSQITLAPAPLMLPGTSRGAFTSMRARTRRFTLTA